MMKVRDASAVYASQEELAILLRNSTARVQTLADD